MIADHDTQTVLDAAQLRPSLRETMANVYREIGAESRRLYAESRSPRHLAEAEYAETRAAALEFGGSITLGALLEVAP